MSTDKVSYKTLSMEDDAPDFLFDEEEFDEQEEEFEDFDMGVGTPTEQHAPQSKESTAMAAQQQTTLTYVDSKRILQPLLRELIYLAAIDKDVMRMDDFQARVGLDVHLDTVDLLAALLGDPNLSQKLAAALERVPGELIYPESVYRRRQQLDTAVSPRTSKSDIHSLDWFSAAERLLEHSSFILPAELAALSEVESEAKLIELITASQFGILPELRQLNPTRSFVKRQAAINQIFCGLSRHLVGQERGFHKLAQFLVSSPSTNTPQGPRAILTFAGPAAVGKSEAARRLCDLMPGYQFKEFNMEQFTDERDVSKLFGSGSQYIDSALGDLTSTAKKYPPTVFIFNEIEKAHPAVIRSLLGPLDTGSVEDFTSRHPVSFDQAIFVFTTNLAQDALSSGSLADAELFSLLRVAKAPEPSRASALAPEFVDRLSKGCGVHFQPLRSEHFFQLSQQQFCGNVSEDGVALQYGERLHLLPPLVGAANLSPRSLPGHVTSMLSQAMTYATTQATDEPICQLHIDVDLPALRSFLSTVVQPPKRIIAMLAEKRFARHLDAGCDELICHDAPVSPAPMLEQMALGSSDLVLLDPRVFHRPKAQLQAYLQQLKTCCPLADVQLLARGKYTDADLALFEQLQLQGLISAVHRLPGRFTRQSAVDLTDTLRDRYMAQVALHELRRRNLKLSWELRAELSDERLKVLFSAFSSRRELQACDALDPSFPLSEVPDTCLGDVIGLEQAKRKLKPLIQQLRALNGCSDAYDLPSGILLVGPPGTGKTMLARAVAGECDLPLFQVDAGPLLSDPEASLKLSRLFAKAEEYAPAVLFIDEIDAIGTRRSHDGSAQSKSFNALANTLLTRLDGFRRRQSPVLIIAATNHPEALDPALTRSGRLEWLVPCELPGREQRSQLIAQLSEQKAERWSQETCDQLASLSSGCSTAHLTQVFREAYRLSACEQTPLTPELWRECLLDVRFGEVSPDSDHSAQSKTSTAWHEAGHLLVSHLLLPQELPQLVTIEPRNNTLGFVFTSSEQSGGPVSRRWIMNKMAVLLAGREAEGLLDPSGLELTIGARNDIERATDLAAQAVLSAGMDETLGPVAFERLPYALQKMRAANADAAISRWLEQSGKQARRLLHAHRAALQTVAETLLSQETLYRDEIMRLIGSLDLAPVAAPTD